VARVAEAGRPRSVRCGFLVGDPARENALADLEQPVGRGRGRSPDGRVVKDFRGRERAIARWMRA